MTADHSHEWDGDETCWYCTQCAETTTTCGTCWGPVTGPRGASSSLLICETCARRERYVLEDIRSALGHTLIAPGSGQLAATRYDRQKITGSRGEAAPRPTVSDVVHQLHQLADTWITTAAHYGVTIPPSADPLDTLRSGIQWAAHNPEVSQWEDYRKAIRAIRARARTIAGLQPRRENAPCPYCGGTVVRDWADRRWEPLENGLSKWVRCTNAACPEDWAGSDVGWDFLKRNHLRTLPQSRPDHLITLEESRLVWPDLPRQTLDSWIRRDREAHEKYMRALEAHEDGEEVPEVFAREIPERDWNERGVPAYRVGDIDAKVRKRSSDTRRGPKVTDNQAEGVV